jgi:hypothetical protein
MRWIITIAALGSLLTAIALQTGCETQSAEGNSVHIEPQVASLYEGQYQDFTASGGFSYTWSLSDESLGYLSSKTGPSVRYFSRVDPADNSGATVQRLTVTSELGSYSDTGGGTNTSSDGLIDTAEAVIEHLSSNDGTPTEVTTTDTSTTSTTTTILPVASVTISPPSANVPQNGSQNFTASGASDTSYEWTLAPTDGSLSSSSGQNISYFPGTVPVGTVVTLTVSHDGYADGTATITIVE